MTDNNEHQHFADLKKVDDEYLDESGALIRRWHEYYSEKFLASDTMQNVLSEKQRGELPFILDNFCDFCYNYHLQKPGQWTHGTVTDVCENIMPRKVMADEAYFDAIAPALTHFLSWMSSKQYLADTDALTKAISSVESNIRRNAKDPNCWGMAKSMMMGAKAKGYDVENHHAIEAALATENADDLLTSAANTDKDLRKPAKTADEIHSIADIINELRYLTIGLPEAALKAAINRQQEIMPLLLELLDEAIKNYDSVGDYDFGYMHAMYLLAQFREKKAFPLVIQVTALPEEYVAPLLGGLITGDLHKIIASVYDGDLAAIQQLIEKPSLYEWCRGAALQSLLVLVKADILDRQWVIHYFKSLFNHPVFKEDGIATTNLVRTAYDLYPAELYDDIKECARNNFPVSEKLIIV